MVEEQRFVSQDFWPEEVELEASLRPHQLTDFIGQKKVVENLTIFIQAARERREALDHVLLYGPPGLGKTSLAHIIASEMGVNVRWVLMCGQLLDRRWKNQGI